jgi:hypothetical protein
MAAAVRGVLAPAGTESAITGWTAVLPTPGVAGPPDVGRSPRPAVWLRTR